MKFLSNTHHRNIIFILAFLILLIGCWEFLSINQPNIAEPSSSFEVPINIALTPEEEGGRGYFGIRLPIGWTVKDSITYTGVLNGTFIYSSELSDSMETYEPSPVGYYWWIFMGDTLDVLPEGNISFTPLITTDEQTGTFFIDYIISDRIDNFSGYVVHEGPYPISVGAPMILTVTNTNDSGEGSLRQAIADVSCNGEILFDLSYPATILLDTTLVLDRSLNIKGPDSGILTISGNNRNRVFYFNENLNIGISNMTIANGNFDYGDGGGIYCNNSKFNLNNVIVEFNSAHSNGGGIYCWNSEISLNNVIIANSHVYSKGGGIYLGFCESDLSNVTITNNIGHLEGGGIYSIHSELNLVNVKADNNDHGGIYSIASQFNCTNVTINNNIDDGGSRGLGSAIESYKSNFVLLNSTLSQNTAYSGGGGIYCSDSSNLTLINTIVWGNNPKEILFSASGVQNSATITYSDIQGGENGIFTYNNGTVHWMEGNIDEDPLFVGSGDYPFTLLSSSPCIDAGNPDTTYNDPEDPNNPGYALWPAMGTLRNDMGAYGGPNAASWIIVGIEDDETEELQTPTVFELSQNYPNPFNPSTTIQYSIKERSSVELVLYDILGRQVVVLVNEEQDAGYYKIKFNAGRLASGIYLYRLRAGDFVETKKMVLMK